MTDFKRPISSQLLDRLKEPRRFIQILSGPRQAGKVDFVLRAGGRVVGIEVKSTQRKVNVPGMEAFGRACEPDRKLLVGGQGIPVEEFLRTPIKTWVSA